MFRYVKVTSDGVTIVDNKTELTGLVKTELTALVHH
jgi:hypothetical protein